MEALKSLVTELAVTKVTSRVVQLMPKAAQQHEMHILKKDIERSNRTLAKLSSENLNANITSTHGQRLPTPVLMPTSALTQPPETSELALSDCRENQLNDHDYIEDLKIDSDQRIMKRESRDSSVEITEDDDVGCVCAVRYLPHRPVI